MPYTVKEKTAFIEEAVKPKAKFVAKHHNVSVSSRK